MNDNSQIRQERTEELAQLSAKNDWTANMSDEDKAFAAGMARLHSDPVGTLKDRGLLSVLTNYFYAPEQELAQIRQELADGEEYIHPDRSSDYTSAVVRRLEALEEHQERFGFEYKPITMDELTDFDAAKASQYELYKTVVYWSNRAANLSVAVQHPDDNQAETDTKLNEVLLTGATMNRDACKEEIVKREGGDCS